MICNISCRLFVEAFQNGTLLKNKHILHLSAPEMAPCGSWISETWLDSSVWWLCVCRQGKKGQWGPSAVCERIVCDRETCWGRDYRVIERILALVSSCWSFRLRINSILRATTWMQMLLLKTQFHSLKCVGPQFITQHKCIFSIACTCKLFLVLVLENLEIAACQVTNYS